jgi:cyclase
MLKVRIMPTLLYKQTTLVKGIRFDSWRRVGIIMQAVKVYNMRQVDELVFMDITATQEGRRPDFELIDEFADECFVPLTVGGGIKDVDDVRRLLLVGADKVSLNTAVFFHPELIKDIAANFGTQCIVVSIDVRKSANGTYSIWTHSGTNDTKKDPVQFAVEAEKKGAGEILLTSIDRDGTMQGYDIEIIRKVTEAVSIPVIASGGAGSYEHMLQAINEGKASAVAAASIFHFTEQTPLEAKKFLKDHGVPTRI